ncbi:P-loop containing nucleoside triphosphate hydrolase protein, partial [Calocera viscosa TUFC12733]
MPRRKPTSLTAKKASQKQKRAIKRGDTSPPPPAPAQRRKRPGHPSRPPVPGRAREEREDDAVKLAARRLESRFLKPSPSYLALSAERASTRPLRRPIPPSAARFPRELLFEDEHGRDLTCPKRPKWRYEMTKKEVERNEEGVFAKWKSETEGRFAQWLEQERESEGEGAGGGPSYYEWNLEVWRQLWRVTELSDILLILLDARCPPLHYPPSLQVFLKQLRPARKLVLVLTKVDVVGHARAEEWAQWLRERYRGEGVRVVMVEAYRHKAPPSTAEEPQGKRAGRRVEPFLPSEFRSQLVRALREAHEELKTPPAGEEGKWKCRVRRDVDWEAVERGLGGKVHQPEHREAERPPPENLDEEGEGEHDAPPEYLTIGLIGQPNVGKSSLLNALFGRPRVRASRTPGKTKHFQTLFLAPEVRLVDCPGLVLPSYVHMELQALAGVLPIAQLPSLPSCISYALQVLPLERIFKLERAESVEKRELEAKKTWRGERPVLDREEGGREGEWTAMQVLESYALAKGWITAKAGRPDVGRAGNAIMRAVAEARIPWGFGLPNG